MDYSKNQPIVEVYKAVQSEGSRIRPTIVVRTTGCTHRCFFGEGGWCDSWYTSIHPEKGSHCLQDIVDMYDMNPQISEMMLTGGSPTMHMKLVNELLKFANTYKRKIFVTIETEGSHFIKTDYPVDLISLSPKFSNSVPVLGEKTPQGKVVDEKFIKQHNKHRLNINAIKYNIANHSDYQIKPVWGGDEKTLLEIEEFLSEVKIPDNKVYLMPAGDTREQLIKAYPQVMEMCIEKGWNFTGRPHIIAYDTQRAV